VSEYLNGVMPSGSKTINGLPQGIFDQGFRAPHRGRLYPPAAAEKRAAA
jgi:hypothetical protein